VVKTAPLPNEKVTIVPMTTEGWKTTEFWFVAALLALVVLNGPLNLGLSAQELISMAIAIAGYSGGRGLAKISNQATTVVAPDAQTTTVVTGRRDQPDAADQAKGWRT
jgi:hypothetical protein